MKPITVKQARKILKQASCEQIRRGVHEAWKRQDGHTFSLPVGDKCIAPGILRNLKYFISGHENYFRR